MGVLTRSLYVLPLLLGAFTGARASEIRQMDYLYRYESAKDAHTKPVFVICDDCSTTEHLALKPKGIPLAIKVTITQPEIAEPHARER